MNGKGSAPRNCFSEQFRSNYESINWKKKKKPTPKKGEKSVCLIKPQ